MPFVVQKLSGYLSQHIDKTAAARPQFLGLISDGGIICFRQRVQTVSEAHAASFSKGTTAYVAGTKRSKYDTHHSPTSRAKGDTRGAINSIPYMFPWRRT